MLDINIIVRENVDLNMYPSYPIFLQDVSLSLETSPVKLVPSYTWVEHVEGYTLFRQYTLFASWVTGKYASFA